MPHFLAHHRRLGVRHFLFVANDCSDGSEAYLHDQPDCSVWTTDAGYKAARFGMDWIGSLLIQYGAGRWCLTLDADELLIYPHWDSRALPDLTRHLDGIGQEAFGTLTVDLYPKGPLSQSDFQPGGDPLTALRWFDPAPYRQSPQPDLRMDLYQGGVRDRVYFQDAPRRAPTLNKLPLARWHWRYAYRNSTHSILPPRLNDAFPRPDQDRVSGVLLHSKFLPSVVERSLEEKVRKQHFARSEAHAAYYDDLARDPVFWSPELSCAYEDWTQLQALGFMSAGAWA